MFSTRRTTHVALRTKRRSIVRPHSWHDASEAHSSGVVGADGSGCRCPCSDTPAGGADPLVLTIKLIPRIPLSEAVPANSATLPLSRRPTIVVVLRQIRVRRAANDGSTSSQSGRARAPSSPRHPRHSPPSALQGKCRGRGRRRRVRLRLPSTGHAPDVDAALERHAREGNRVRRANRAIARQPHQPVPRRSPHKQPRTGRTRSGSPESTRRVQAAGVLRPPLARLRWQRSLDAAPGARLPPPVPAGIPDSDGRPGARRRRHTERSKTKWSRCVGDPAVLHFAFWALMGSTADRRSRASLGL